MIKELNERNFDENIKNGIKLVFFSAIWCGFCSKQKPILNELSEQKIWIGEVDSDKNPALIEKFNIKAFPSFLLFKNGNVIASFSGYKDKYDLLNTLLSYLQ